MRLLDYCCQDGKRLKLKSIIASYILNPLFRVQFLFRLSQYRGGGIYEKIYNYECLKLNRDIPVRTQIGPGLLIPHGYPVVINPDAIIGENCIIHPCVLIGRDRGKSGAPIIGNNVFIGNGAKIIGNPKIGDYVFISPGAVITKNIPEGSLVGSGVNLILNDNGREHVLLYNRDIARVKSAK